MAGQEDSDSDSNEASSDELMQEDVEEDSDVEIIEDEEELELDEEDDEDDDEGLPNDPLGILGKQDEDFNADDRNQRAIRRSEGSISNNSRNYDEEDTNFQSVSSPGSQLSQSKHSHPRWEAHRLRRAKDLECIEPGFKVLNRMTPKDVNTLLKRLQSDCSPLERLVYHKRVINWKRIAFGSFTPEDCRLAWMYLKLTTRSYRNMRELVDEVMLVYNHDRRKFRDKLLQLLPSYPKDCRKNGFNGSGLKTYAHHAWLLNPDKNQGPASYFNFVAQMKSEFEKLSEAEKTMWDEVSKMEDEQRQLKIKEFYAQFPTLPLKGLVEYEVRPRQLFGKFGSEFVGNSQREPLTRKPLFPLLPRAAFVESKIKRIEPTPTDDELPSLRTKYSAKWEKLDDNTKAKWIDLFVQKCQLYIEDNAEYKRRHPEAEVKLKINMLRWLTHKGFHTWEKYRQKPEAPPSSTRWLFQKLYAEQPVCQNMSKEEINEKAYQKWDAMAPDEKALYKIHCVRLHEQYKKEIETYYSSIPDIMKPLTMKTIPPKFRKTLTYMVDKVSDYVRELKSEDEDKGQEGEEVITSTEYYAADDEVEQEPQLQQEVPASSKPSTPASELPEYDEDEEIDLDNEPLIKRIKFQKQKQTENETEKSRSKRSKTKHRDRSDHDRERGRKKDGDREDEDEEGNESDSSLEVIYDEGVEVETPSMDQTEADDDEDQETAAGAKSLIDKAKLAKIVEIGPGSHAVRKVLDQLHRLTRRNRDDIIRGIFDSIPSLGRSFTPLYYYAKYAILDRFWIRKVFKLGVPETAELIFLSFKTLSQHQKHVFTTQSIQFNHQLNTDRHQTVRGRRHNKLTIQPGVYFPNEPIPPPTSVEQLYHEIKPRNPPGAGPAPSWAELNLETQISYMKKLYNLNQKYVEDYERFIQTLNPPQLLSYVMELYKGWERIHLKPAESRMQSYLSMLPKVGAGPPSESESQQQQQQSLRERQNQDEEATAGPSTSTSSAGIESRPPTLNNDDYISWLTKIQLQEPPRPIIPEEARQTPRHELKRLRAQQRQQGPPEEDDDPNSDDERIPYRNGKRVGSKQKIRRHLPPLEQKLLENAYENALKKGFPGLQQQREN